MSHHSHSIESAAASIVSLINSSPRSPHQSEIEAIIAKALAPQPLASPAVPTLALDIHAKIAQLHAAYAALAKLKNGPECDAAEAHVEKLKAELVSLEEQMPKPPRTYADVRTQAELSLYWCAESIADLRDCGDLIEQTLADLIEAVLEFDGAAAIRSQSAATAPP